MTAAAARLAVPVVVIGVLCAGAALAQAPAKAAPPADGDLETPAGSPAPSMGLTAGSPSPIMRFVFSGIVSGRSGSGLSLPDGSAAGPFAVSGSDVAVAGVANGGSGTPPSHGSTGTLRAIGAAHRGGGAGGSAPGCYDDYIEDRLQSGGAFWTPQARSAVPVRFPAAVFTGNRAGSRDPVALGPAGHPVNLPAEGKAGSWCRPPPVPMSQSSPLATRAFWIVVLFPTCVFLVFWLSRGLRIGAVPEP